MAIREDSATVYQATAGFRRELANNPDLPADVLREMMGQLLTAVELLLQAVDRNEDVLEQRLEQIRRSQEPRA